MYHKILRDYLFQRVFDILISISIICVLVILYIEAASPIVKMARTTQLAGTPFFHARLETMFYHAVNGEWPRDNAAAENRWLHDRQQSYHYGTSVETVIHDGAVDFIFNEKLDGKRLTLRPAVPAQDPLGPVCWVNTPGPVPAGWTVFGEDRTDLDKALIHVALYF